MCRGGNELRSKQVVLLCLVMKISFSMKAGVDIKVLTWILTSAYGIESCFVICGSFVVFSQMAL